MSGKLTDADLRPPAESEASVLLGMGSNLGDRSADNIRHLTMTLWRKVFPCFGNGGANQKSSARCETNHT